MQIGTFTSKRWGQVHVSRATYGAANGPMAITLSLEGGEPLAKLSVNMYRPECSHDSKDLPPGCFYVKNYGGNERLADEALASGMFKLRRDLPAACSGFVHAPVWELVNAAPAPAPEPTGLRGYIDITGANMVNLVKQAYAVSRPQGMGLMHYQPGGLTNDEARAIADAKGGIHMDYVKGRAVKLSVVTFEGRQYIPNWWFDHTAEELIELLRAIGMPGKTDEVVTS